MLIGAGLLAAVTVAASAGDRWLLPGILVAAAAAAAVGWWGRPAPSPVRAVAWVALAAMAARTFAGYLMPDHRVLAAVLAVGVAAAAVAFGVGVPVPARRLVTGFLLVAAAGFVAVAFGVDPPPSPEAAATTRPTGLLFPAVAVFGLFAVGEPDAPRRRALGRIAVAAAAACAVVAAAAHQLGVTRFALSDVPIRDALIAADAAALGTMLDVVVVVATVPALVAALAAARDDIGSPGRLPHAAVAVLAGAVAAALAAVAGTVACLLIASTVALVGGVFGVVDSARSRFHSQPTNR